MKRFTLIFIVIMLFSASIMLSSCADKTEVSAAVQTNPKLTIDQIKSKYIDSKIKDIRNIGKDYVLVESQRETYFNQFDLYNLSTGDMDTMPTMPEFVTLEKVENENYIIFQATGKNSESPFVRTPYLIRCIRTKTEVDKPNDFIALTEEKYFDLSESIQLGTKGESEMSDMNISYDGLQVLFKALKGKEQEFYAAATDIPPTKTSYDKDKKQLTFEINCKELGQKLKAANKTALPDNQYISAYQITQKDSKIYLVLDLKEAAAQYQFSMKRLPDGAPYFNVSLASNL